MEEIKQWFKDNGIALGSLVVTGGLGFLFGRKGRKKLIRQAAIRENHAYFIGTKDGAIRALSNMLKKNSTIVSDGKETK